MPISKTKDFFRGSVYPKKSSWGLPDIWIRYMVAAMKNFHASKTVHPELEDIALIDNWWAMFVRLTILWRHAEAIPSSPHPCSRIRPHYPRQMGTWYVILFFICVFRFIQLSLIGKEMGNPGKKAKKTKSGLKQGE